MTIKKTFESLGLSDSVLNAINSKGFEEPTAIQAMTIPVMLKNESNIIAQAQTGTGKTAAFGLPLIDMLDHKSQAVQAIILTPTRELAIQVAEEINSLKGDNKVRVVPIYGGQSIDQQLRRLKSGVDIVVGTPGRVIDHINSKTVKLGDIKHLVLDEADEMLNMGFIDDMEEIIKHTNPQKKMLLFSATMPKKIRDLAEKYMEGYELLTVEKEQLTTNLTEQIYFEVRVSERIDALCRIIDVEEDFYGLVFCRTKNDVDTITTNLCNRGYDAESIHGDISQSSRERTLERFKKKFVNILVATDVAARGIDVNNLTHVINYSLPQDPESYVHRIGRTGRAGNEGTAITFISPSEYKQLMFIKRIARTDIKKSELPNVKDIIKAKKGRVQEELATILEGDIDEKYYSWAKSMTEHVEPLSILAALLKLSYDEDMDPKSYGEISVSKGPRSERDNAKNSGRRGAARRETNLEELGLTRLFVAFGKKDKMTPQKIVKLVSDRSSVKSKQISDIRVMDKFSFITVPFDCAEEIINSFKQKGKRDLITHAKN